MAKQDAVDSLTAALKAGDEARVRLLLAGTVAAAMDTTDSHGYTPLYAACTRSEDAMALHLCQLLLKHKPKVDLKGTDKETPLFIAVQNHLTKTVEYLLSVGANVNEKNGPAQDAPLHQAARFGYDDLVTILLRKGADINARNSKLETPLFLAAKLGRISTVYKLLTEDANRNLPNEDGKNPLYIASECGHKGIVGMLKSERKEDLKELKYEADVLEKEKPPEISDPAALRRQLEKIQKQEEEEKRRADAAMKQAEVIKIEVPVERAALTHDPLTGKPLPPEFKSVVGASPAPYIPPGVVKPLPDERYGGTIRRVGTGTGMAFDEKPLVVDDVIPDDTVVFSVNNATFEGKKKRQ